MKYLLIILFAVNTIVSFAQKTLTEDERELLFNDAFVEASKMRMQGHYKDAADLYKTCLELKPNSAASMFELSKLMFSGNNISFAIKLMENAIEINGTNEWYKNYLFELYKYSLEGKKAIKLKKEMIKNNPNSVKNYYHLIEAYKIEENHKEVIETFNQIESRFGKSNDLIEEKVRYYLSINDKTNAIEYVKSLLISDETNVVYLNVLAEIYFDTGEFAEALKIYNKLEIIDDSDISRIYIAKAEIFQKQRKIDSLVNQFKLIFGDGNISYDIKQQIYSTYFFSNNKEKEFKDSELELLQLLNSIHPDIQNTKLYLAQYYIERNEYDSSKVYLYNFLEKDKSNFEVYSQLFFIEHKSQNWDSIGVLSKEAVELYPSQYLGNYYYGLFLFMKERFSESISVLNNGIIYVTDKSIKLEFYSLLAEANYKLGNKGTAFNYYDEVLKINPSDVTVLNNYSYYLSVDNKDLEKALEMTIRCNELSKDNAIFLDTYAWVLFKLERYEDAKNKIEKALSLLSEENGEILEHYGDILFRMGDVSKAVDIWIRAKSLDGVSSDINNKIRNKSIE